MKYLAAVAALALLASSAAVAQSTDPSQRSQPQASSSEAGNQPQPAPQLAPQFIRQIQRQLKQAGAYQGTPSGTWDEETADALEQFQQAHNIQPSGQLDGLTLLALLRQQRPPPNAPEGMAGSSEPPTRATPGPGLPLNPTLEAYERGYRQGFERGFALAIQQQQQQ